MRHTSARGLLTVLSTAALAVAIAAHTPDSPSPQSEEQPPVRFRTEANFVRVDVYPTADGRPVRDLTKADFEILEDGVAQSVETFEYVHVRPAGPQRARVEPSSREAGEQMAANPRNRVFVVFLDVPHVTVAGAHKINEPLIRLLDRIIAPEDLVGVMTSEMSTSQLVLGRKTEVLAGALRDNWPWGQRSRIGDIDERESLYRNCYNKWGEQGVRLARKMRERRRERRTLEALEDLVVYVQSIREERKAIITISEGWALYPPDLRMLDLLCVRVGTERVCEEPGKPEIGIGPGGKLTAGPPASSPESGTTYQCDTERQILAHMDNEQFFRDLLQRANRANASFYPVDPRGLPAFDNDLGPEPPPSLIVDQAQLRGRLSTLRTLAESTDGMAILNNNDLDRGLQRVAADLTSYYLLGYYSTNPTLDGRYRQLRVRVRRPGVSVRARRGYLAATEAEVAAARRASAPALTGPAAALKTALGALSRIRPGAALFVNASAAAGASTIWVAGELASLPGGNPWSRGATADVSVGAGTASGTARVTLAAGERGFVVPVELPVPQEGQVDVRVRVSAADRSTTPATEIVRLDVSPGVVQPLLFRRGPATSHRWRPAADFRFSRTERLRVEVPLSADAKRGNGRLLDQNGNGLEVPVAVTARVDDATGQRWLTGEMALAPLGPGDYAIELDIAAAGGEQKFVTAFRVTR